jgi:hypothetical protein
VARTPSLNPAHVVVVISVVNIIFYVVVDVIIAVVN